MDAGYQSGAHMNFCCRRYSELLKIAQHRMVLGHTRMAGVDSSDSFGVGLGHDLFIGGMSLTKFYYV